MCKMFFFLGVCVCVCWGGESGEGGLSFAVLETFGRRILHKRKFFSVVITMGRLFFFWVLGEGLTRRGRREKKHFIFLLLLLFQKRCLRTNCEEWRRRRRKRRRHRSKQTQTWPDNGGRENKKRRKMEGGGSGGEFSLLPSLTRLIRREFFFKRE